MSLQQAGAVLVLICSCFALPVRVCLSQPSLCLCLSWSRRSGSLVTPTTHICNSSSRHRAVPLPRPMPSISQASALLACQSLLSHITCQFYLHKSANKPNYNNALCLFNCLQIQLALPDNISLLLQGIHLQKHPLSIFLL